MDVRYSGYRSGGSVDDRGVFNFEDEYGNDPLLTRYASDPWSRELSDARVERSASDVALARASLDAVTAPVKTMASFLADINNTVKQQEDMYRTARVSGQTAQLRPLVEKASTWQELNALRADPNYSDGWMDESLQAIYEAKKSGVRGRDLADFQNRLNSAMSVDEVNAAASSLPVEYYADPDASRSINALIAAANTKVGALRATSAATAIGRAANTDELLRTKAQFGDVLNDPLVAASAERNEKQLQLESDLRGAGIDPAKFAVRSGPDGEELGYDYEAAQTVLDARYDPQDIRTIQGAINNLTKQLDNYPDPADPEAARIRTDIDALNRQMSAAMLQQEQGAAVARDVLQKKGVTTPDWIDAIIGGQDSTTEVKTAATPASAATAQTPNKTQTVSARQPAPKAEKQAAPAKTEEPPAEPYSPNDRLEIARLEEELRKAREAAGLSAQPAGIRTVNEALAVQYAPVREKADQLDEAKERINPFGDSDPTDAQSIHAALNVVYPAMDGGGFDIGNQDDARVISAAEYLSRVSPGLLRSVAASPSRTGSRAGLTLEEIPRLAAKAKPSGRGRKSNADKK